MKRRGLSESLLSSSQNLIQDKHQLIMQESQDSNLQKLYRKFNQSLPQLQKENKLKSRPLIPSLIFSPLSKFIIGWKILNIALIYMYFIQIPIILAFENHRSQEYNERFFKIINTPTIIIFICGIFVDMNTSFYQDGLLRKDRQEIRKKYFKKKFILDLISILTIVIYQVIEVTKQFQNQSLKILVVLFYIKFLELRKNEENIIGSFDLNRRIKAAFKFFLLLVKILLLCNIAACSAFYISSYLFENYYISDQLGNQCTEECYWVINVTYAGRSIYDYDSSFAIQYIYSLYWASTTMTSIGYGDITPRNPYQVGFTVILQFIACLLYAYSINQIWNIIQELNAKQTKIHSRLNLINLYMRDKQINSDLTSRVNAYLNNFYYTKNLRQRDAEAEIIDQLTPSLRKQLFYQSYSLLFGQKYFRKINKNLKENLCCLVKQVGYFEAQMILIDDQHKQPSLFYVKKGELQYQCGGLSHRFVKNYYSKDIFGTYEFFSLLLFKSQLRTIKYTLLFHLKASDWKKALKNYEQDRQQYYEAKDQVLLYNNGFIIGYSCQFCNSKRHRTQDCLDYQLRLTIKQIIAQQKIKYNKRALFFRKEFKQKNHQIHKKKRKYTIRVSQMHKLEASTHSLRNHLPQAPRKSSIEEHFDNKKGKLKIKNERTKHQNLKALEKIRKMHYKDDLPQASNESQSIYQMRYQELNMDVVMEYSEYYPHYNISQINFRQKESARRRHSRLR